VGGETRHWWREGQEGLVFFKGEVGALTRVGVASEHGSATMGGGAGEVERRRDDGSARARRFVCEAAGVAEVENNDDVGGQVKEQVGQRIEEAWLK
jgi:hypothetical protein